MPPPPIVDLQEIDLERVLYGPDEIKKRIPHRHEMLLLSNVLSYDPEAGIIVGDSHVPEDTFWVRGHIPGRPLLPGVLMIETAAQLCSFYWGQTFPEREGFFGFGGVDTTRFRGTVAPGDRLVIVGRSVNLKPRRAVFDAQGFVDGKMVFETRILGVIV